MDTKKQVQPRRDFLKSAAASVGAASLLASSGSAFAGGSDVIKVGLIGCGGRGRGAMFDAMKADKGVRITALGDLFPDHLEKAKQALKSEGGEQNALKDANCFTGFDAYKQVIASGVDLVLLATPPHFRPIHLRAAIEAGKHVFCEKPVAVDSPGVRSVLESSKLALQKNLNLVSGFCYRHDKPKVETVKRIHEGAIGRIITLNVNYNTRFLWHKDRQPGWSDMEWQLRNWLYFTWLSGDHIVEQHIHNLDKAAWVLGGQYPIKAWGMGGRQVRTQKQFGHIYDHHAVCYEYESGQRVFSFCRQQDGTAVNVSDWIFGEAGTAELMSHTITGSKPWRFVLKRGSKPLDMYEAEHLALFGALRAGKTINDGEFMCKSTMMAIMGRMATYTGQVVTWDAAMNSTEDLSPAKYEFGPIKTPPVPMPGIG